MRDLPSRLAPHLLPDPGPVHAPQDARLAAVLLPLYHAKGEWQLLYTRRTDTVESHRGQVSFPGGMVEERDATPRETALREAEEEIGLDPAKVRILGSLDPMLTITQFKVIPFVGVIPWPTELRISTQEVATVFGVPLSWLLQEGNLEVRIQPEASLGLREAVHAFRPYQGEVIWGATARITLDLLRRLRSAGFTGN